MTQPEGSSRIDVQEHGSNQQTSARRLYMQLQVFCDCEDPKRLTGALERARVEGVLYANAADPLGVGVLGIAEDPAFFVGRWRELLGSEPFLGLRRRPELTMFGRTYASGFETELEDWLLQRPRRTVLNPSWPWGIWYPLRRNGAFARLTPQEQGGVIREHSATVSTFTTTTSSSASAAASCTRCRTWSRRCARPPRPPCICRRWGRSSSVTRSGRAHSASTPMARRRHAPARLNKKLAAFVELERVARVATAGRSGIPHVVPR